MEALDRPIAGPDCHGADRPRAESGGADRYGADRRGVGGTGWDGGIDAAEN